MPIQQRSINLRSHPRDEVLQLPQTATASLPTAGATNEGCIAYDVTTSSISFSDGANWTDLSTTAGVGTLQQVTTAGVTSDVASIRFSGSAASATALGIGGAAANDKIVLYHDATNGHINTLAGDLHLEPAGGDTYVTGDIYTDANLVATGAVNGATGTIGAVAVTATLCTVTGPAAHATNTLQYTPVLFTKGISHGDEDGNFDVTVFNASTPKMVIDDVWLDVDTADGAATTGALRTAANSAGNPISSEISQNSAVIAHTTTITSNSVAAGVSLFWNSTAALTNFHGTLYILGHILA
jgi:hypothetical protein